VGYPGSTLGWSFPQPQGWPSTPCLRVGALATPEVADATSVAAGLETSTHPSFFSKKKKKIDRRRGAVGGERERQVREREITDKREREREKERAK
jgi:hypothetical protein